MRDNDDSLILPTVNVPDPTIVSLSDRRAHQDERFTGSDVRELKPRVRQVIRLRFQGSTNIEIAEVMDMTSVRVCQILNSPLARTQMNIMQNEADADAQEASKLKLGTLAPKAIDLYERILDEDVENSLAHEASLSLRQKTAESVMDRVGMPKSTTVTQTNTSLTLSGDDIAMIRERAQAVDVPAVVVEQE